MPSGLSYPYEKFMVAVSGMAASPRSIQERLESAYMSFHTLKADDFDDPDMRSAFEEIEAALTAQEASRPGEGRLQATLRAMSTDDAQHLAGKIVDLFLDIARTHLSA